METIGLITARGGSKGVPGKNIAPVGGKPLIGWTVDAARAASRLDRVLVSTDDAGIAQVARDCGAEVPFLRPAELASDRASHISVVLHALDWLASEGIEPRYLVLLQPTSPLRTAADIDGAITLAYEKDADGVVSVCPARDHPLLVKKITPEGVLADYATTELAYLRRQDLPEAYALNGAVYVTRATALREQRTFLPRNTHPYVMPAERSLEVDHPWDLHLARLIMEERACPSKPLPRSAA
jgi:CMP-N,N'-diacetyllegionaminic acid synthase